MSKKKVIIIGAGPAGLSCAYELLKNEVEVEIYESSNFIGGMSRSFDLWGQKVDMGPHRFFSNNKNVNDFFKEIIQDNYTLVNRKTRIYYRNKFFDYPLKFGNVIKNLPLITINRILFDFLIQKLRPIKNPSTFEEWVTNRFGKRLYEIFFKSYTEKLWGINGSKIDANWAAQRIKTLSLVSAVITSIIGDRKNKHKTLVDQFAYPKNGSGSLYEKCAEIIINKGGKIHLGQSVKKVINNDAGEINGILLSNNNVVNSDIVVSTMPFTTLVEGIENIPSNVLSASNELYFRNTILIYLEIDKLDLFDDNWLYIHSSDVLHGRITNFRNWCPSLNNSKSSSILCMEIWAFDNDDIWKYNDDKISRIAKKELLKLKLLPEKTEIKQTQIIKVPKCYPVYETGYQKHLKILEDFIDNYKNLYPIGRYGSFKYNNQDHSILMGILTAKNIFNEDHKNLWSINTDTDYQEKGEINDVLN